MNLLEDFGRRRLSKNFFMREMLYSENANFYGLVNIPDDPELCVAAGSSGKRISGARSVA